MKGPGGAGGSEGPRGEDGPEDSPDRMVAVSRFRSRIEEISLLLASQGIAHRVEAARGRFGLFVDAGEAQKAFDHIRLYRRENRGYFGDWMGSESGRLDLLLSPLLYLLIPVAFYFLIGFAPDEAWLVEKGLAQAGRIRAGEWWRCVTALTLHADHGHFLSNLVSGFFLLNLLNHRLGIGTVMLLVTAVSALANLLVALASSPLRSSLGFSTAVFCSLGVLAALESRRLLRLKEEGESLSLRHGAPLFAAFFLAVITGLGERSDIKAHFFGFGLGAAAGLLHGEGREGWRGLIPQAMMGILTYAGVAFCWGLATGFDFF